MDMADRLFIATLLTLALFVIFIERNRAMNTPQIIPPNKDEMLARNLNVPTTRENSVIINDVAYMDVTDAAEGEFR